MYTSGICEYSNAFLSSALKLQKQQFLSFFLDQNVVKLLGKGHIKEAEKSAYKSLFMSLILSGGISLLIGSLSNVLPS